LNYYYSQTGLESFWARNYAIQHFIWSLFNFYFFSLNYDFYTSLPYKNFFLLKTNNFGKK